MYNYSTLSNYVHYSICFGIIHSYSRGIKIMASLPGESELVVVEIDIGTGDITIVPESGNVYTYRPDEINPDVLMRLYTADADFTLYSQSETLNQEDYDELMEDYLSEWYT
jgi:hypothetical protein